MTPPTPSDVKVSGITLGPANPTVTVGGTVQLTAAVAPDNASNKTLNWSSGDKKLATVDAASGLVTGVAAGTVDITASAKDGSSVTNKISVTVSAPAPTIGKLTVAATAADGGQTIAVTPAAESGHMFRYKITEANAVPVVAYDEACISADGWIDMPDSNKVSGTKGQVITVVEMTTIGANARKVGTTTLPAPTTSAGA